MAVADEFTENPLGFENTIHLFVQNCTCEVAKQFLYRYNQKLIYKYIEKGWEIDGIESRTIQFLFGKLTFKRHRLRKEGEKSFLPLDKTLGLPPRDNYSAGVKLTCARLSARMPFRQATKTIQELLNIDISHGTVHALTQEVGQKVQKYIKNVPNISDKKRKVKHLFIEGDAVYLGSRDPSQRHLVMHRIIIHEGSGTKEGSERKVLKNVLSLESFESSEAVFRQAQDYLDRHYNLKHTTVYSNSDGGSGYEVDKFKEIIGLAAEHHHRLDLYHAYQKIRQKVYFDKKLMPKLLLAVQTCSELEVHQLLDTIESRIILEEFHVLRQKYTENISELRGYLHKNWQYLAPLKSNKELSLGVCESSHRIYTFRMKRQGRSWTKAGAANLVAIINCQQQNSLEKAYFMDDEDLKSQEILGKEIKGAVREALKTQKTESYGVIKGIIPNKGASSNPIGYLAKLFS